MALRLGSKRVCAALRAPRPFAFAPVSVQRYASSAATAASSLPNGVKESIEREASLATPDPAADSQTTRLVNDQMPYMVPTYVRPPPMFHKGEGCYLYDVENRKYLDFTAGIAVNALGHCDPQMVKLMAEQAQTLIHTSNLYHNPWTGALSKLLVEKTVAGGGMHTAEKTFICNSGSEANEAAIKFARKVGKELDPSGEKYELVSFHSSFHGRTMGSLSATPNPKYQKPFAPMVPGFRYGTYNDIEAIPSLVTESTCGVIIEPIQGEGGVNVATPEFLLALRKRCTEVGAVLIYDEIQSGLGRTGQIWAHAALPKEAHPDILTTAKALGNGFPIGATIVNDFVVSKIKPGDHGTTFGGNPLACRLAHDIVGRLADPQLHQSVLKKEQIFRQHFEKLKQRFPDVITEIRGKGLILGLQLNQDPTPILTAARERGLLIITCGTNTLRFVPPLIISEAEIEQGINILEDAMNAVFKNTTKVSHKPYKSRHASKSALKEQSKGKIDSGDRGARRTPHQQVLSKLDRRNQAKQKRVGKHAEHVEATRVFAGRDGAPRVVAVVPLADDVSGRLAVGSLNGCLDLDVGAADVPEQGALRVEVERFKQRVQYLVVGRGLLQALDACRVADFVLFVLSAEQEVDALGELVLRSVESQGVSNVLAAVQGLDSAEPAKRRPQILGSLKSFITHFFPAQEKVHSLDNRQECLNLMRSLCTSMPKGVRWREERSWMAVEDVRWPSGKAAATEEEAKGDVVLTGVVRGKGLKADRLVEVGDWGTFQIEKITAAPLATRKKGKGEDMAVDMEGQDAVLDQPTEDQDDLAELAPEEAVMEDADDYPVSIAPSERKGVLLDDHHYFSEDEEAPRPKRLPRGTSKYQSAWYIDELSDSGSDLESVAGDDDGDFDMDGPANPADGMEGLDINGREPTEAAPSEYPQSEMFMDPSPDDEAEQIEAYRTERKKEAEDDLEFPDEIELHPQVLARERLIKYRGLKSLRTSTWETDEDRPYEPDYWRRLLEISDYKGAKSRVLREALVGGVQPGTRVNVHLRNVPLSLQSTYNPAHTLALFSLLRHEHKRTAVNYSITLSSDYEEPIKSKEEMIVQCGPRRFRINPVFSASGNTPNDVHKFDRFLHPGRSAIATFVAPITWGSVPALFFRRAVAEEDEGADGEDTAMEADKAADAEGEVQLIGTGTSLAPSTSRVISKRIILTGHPYKIHKRVVTVRYMFFNSEDVQWFKALQLWTKRGRSGFIKESLGTHGYFKATFDGRINPQDSVGVSLYKRVWPREARALEAGEAL
ncbi:putative pre-rrna processing protein [Neofusicoccum parvum UCRNP2]|uniref:acetylornithine transaminase n=1 Tax=Botryosphaeria parva (strain UCR-NP2) TaxID=1287680 RepID=R1G4S8_BOTPV|nr:putative pre-rrna processing protein [Neofusicoccum parvum UCRNP2]